MSHGTTLPLLAALALAATPLAAFAETPVTEGTIADSDFRFELEPAAAAAENSDPWAAFDEAASGLGVFDGLGGAPRKESGSTLIIGGTTVRASDPIAATTAALLNGNSLCTVSLLSPNLALTAAHCVQGLRTGGAKLVFGQRATAGIDRAVTGAVYHSRYGTVPAAQPDHGDVAVVRFGGGLPSGYRVAKFLRDSSAVVAGDPVTLAGYGITQTHPHTGSGTLRKVKTEVMLASFGKTETVFDQREGRGACHGDSGGPAFVGPASRPVVLGLTNRGYRDPGDTCGQYVVYTKVSAYLSWIRAAAAKLGGSASF